MKKHLNFILILCTFSSFAQYVQIPDVHLRDRLQQLYPSCFNTTGLMDTSCKAIVVANDLDLSEASIQNLNGIQYFKALKNLDCASNNLKSITILPSRLRSLDCRNNQLSYLPTLPANLKVLDCSHNMLQTLVQLPSQLNYLICENNQLKRLPNLPSTLKTLWAFGNCFETAIANPSPNTLTNFIVSPNGTCATSSARLSNTPEETLVYPNPAQNQIHINSASNSATYRIFDAIGTLRLSYTGTDKSIDITPLTPGIYFIKIHSDAEDSILKFTKE